MAVQCEGRTCERCRWRCWSLRCSGRRRPLMPAFSLAVWLRMLACCTQRASCIYSITAARALAGLGRKTSPGRAPCTATTAIFHPLSSLRHGIPQSRCETQPGPPCSTRHSRRPGQVTEAGPHPESRDPREPWQYHREHHPEQWLHRTLPLTHQHHTYV